MSASYTETRHRTRRTDSYGWLALAALLVAVATGHPELIALGAPFVLAMAIGLAAEPGRIADVEFSVSSDRVIVGDIVELTITGTATRSVSEISVMPAFAGLEPVDDGAVCVSPDRNGEFTTAFRLRADGWGDQTIGPITMRSADWLGMFTSTTVNPAIMRIRAHPPTEQLRALAEPRRTNVGAGMHLAKTRGEGIEFADIRPFTTGDRLSAINWRATARRSEPWVNEQHPDRAADVVLFLDTFEDLERDGETSLRLAVEAASTLARHHGAIADRIGLVELGGVFRWIQPGSGSGHLHQIVDALLNTRAFVTEADKTIEIVPIKALPPGAMVVALTPLLDTRGTTALFDLLGRRHDVVVVETVIDNFVDPSVLERNALSARLWQLEREDVRLRLRDRGARVVSWSGNEPFAAVLAAMALQRSSPARPAAGQGRAP